MSRHGKGLRGWLVAFAIFGAVGFYVWREKPRPAPVSRPVWTLQKYDSGKFYFSEDFITEFRAACESADCTQLLDHVQIGLLGQLNGVKREGLHLSVQQNGVEYHFKIEAIGTGVLHDESTDKGNAQDDSR